MKAVHAASVAGTAAVEAAARAINDQLRPNSSVAPVALQNHLPRQQQNWAQQFIQLKRRQRRAGNRHLRPLCYPANRFRGTGARLLLALKVLRHSLPHRRGRRARSSRLLLSRLRSRGMGADCFRENRFHCDAAGQKRRLRIIHLRRAHAIPAMKHRANRLPRRQRNLRP